MTCDHFDPFQRTENGSSRFCEWLNKCQPTARQSFAETQVTPSSSAPLCGKWIGLGLGTTDQVLPFQRSMSASPRPCASEKWSPTATQSLAPAHHTPCSSPAIAAALCSGRDTAPAAGERDAPATAAVRSDTAAARAARLLRRPGRQIQGNFSHAESLRSMLNWADMTLARKACRPPACGARPAAYPGEELMHGSRTQPDRRAGGARLAYGLGQSAVSF